MAKKNNGKNWLFYVIVFVVIFAYSAYQGYGDGYEDGAQSNDNVPVEQEIVPATPRLDLSAAVEGNFRGNQMIEHTGFVVSFCPKTNCPSWVAWELTAAETKGSQQRSNYAFMPDAELPMDNQVVTGDYTGSGFDRGHMCPAADMKWSADAMHDCFYMSNICPQTPQLNQNWWEHVESACRRWAKREGEIFIACGPIFHSKIKATIGREHRVAVPDGFYKVIISLREGAEKGIAFRYRNDDSRQTMEDAAMSIDKLEKQLKLDFFSEVPDSIEQVIESQCDLRAWN